MTKISSGTLGVKGVIIWLIIILSSCCPFVKEEYLGNDFVLSEFDNVDRRILYSKARCSGSGRQIVPMTVLEYAFDDNWIIAKTDVAYWIVNKDANIRFISDSTASNHDVIEAHLNGPYDSATFVQKLFENAIKLKLRKI